MKKTVSLIIIFTLLFLTSCERKQDAYEILNEFVSLYGAEGIIYSPSLSEGQSGYIREGVVERIFLFLATLLLFVLYLP